MVYPTYILFFQGAPAANPLMQFIPLLAIVGIFYFLVFMPMQRQRKQQKQMLSELQNGSVVLTTGGLVGTIVSMNADDDTLIIRIKPDSVKLQIVRSAVSSLVTQELKKA